MHVSRRAEPITDAAGLQVTEDDPGWSRQVARRLMLISAQKPLAAA